MQSEAEIAYQMSMLECIHCNDAEKLQEFISYNGFHEFVSPEGLQPAHYAAYNQALDSLKILVKMGANVNEYNPMIPSVLQYALQGYLYDEDIAVEMVRTLTAVDDEGKQAVSHRDILGEALQYACGEGYSRIVPLLLDAGAHPDYVSESDEYKMTPLVGMIFENSYMESHGPIVEMLLSAGADINHMSNGQTALDYAMQYNRNDILTILSNHKTN